MTQSALYQDRPVAVALASRNRLLVQRLRASITPPMQVVHEATSVGEIVALARLDPPDLVLLDVDLPGGVVEAVRELADRELGTVVVITDDTPDDTVILRILRAGAAGLLPASTPAARLGHALSGVLRGEAALPRTQVGVLLAEFQARPGRTVIVRGRRVRLTPRELEVLQHLRHRRGTSAIAALLGIAPTTVRTHVAALLRKARVGSREELVRALAG